MKVRGRKAIALGERDGVPGEAISACLTSAGAEVVLVRTECFV
jgi:betaine reductase